MPEHDLPLIDELTCLAASSPDTRLTLHGYVTTESHRYPLLSLEMGNQSMTAPTVCYIGGIHGMERIGSEVCLAFLHTLIARKEWDIGLQALLSEVKVVFYPTANPAGLAKGTRCNPNGVDLMRNAPQDADSPVPPLVGGHRISSFLPWYRGKAGMPMEQEASTLGEIVRSHFEAPLLIAMDCHSGFGLRDRIWFPYARTHDAPKHLPEAFSLRELFNTTFPQHSFYLMEPQSATYCTHGDLWDALYDEYTRERTGVFLPFTLEMGSWLWIRKNPVQLLNTFGHFNPVIPHRLERVLRRHLTLFNFLIQAAAAGRYWLPTPSQRKEIQSLAISRWYGKTNS